MPDKNTNDEKFDNASFWNHRYEFDPALGSGVGSMGPNLLHKRAIVSAFLKEVNPADILDVGCGDCEVLSGIELPASYLGVDISSSIVARNRSRFPANHLPAWILLLSAMSGAIAPTSSFVLRF